MYMCVKRRIKKSLERKYKIKTSQRSMERAILRIRKKEGNMDRRTDQNQKYPKND